MTASMKPVSITLGSRERSFLANMVDKGRFGTATEVVRASRRLLEDYEYNQKAIRLRALIAAGDSDIVAGRVTEYADAEEFAQRIIEQGDRRLKATD